MTKNKPKTKKIKLSESELLSDKLNAVCMEYIKRFCIIQDVAFDGWEGGYCDSCVFNGIIIKFSDIVHDVNSIAPKGAIFDYISSKSKLSYKENLKAL